MTISEAAFESHIDAWLFDQGGYIRSDPARFDRRRGLNLDELGEFVRSSQPRAWERLVNLHRNDDRALSRFADRVATQIDERGTVDVLRHGVVDLGVEVRLAFFRPAHGLTPELEHRYRANITSVCRQLNYEEGSGKDVDVAILVNGIPTATAELKNPYTGQNVSHAVAQYRRDRDPHDVTLGRRAVVHFAVDPHRVQMTTRLRAKDTVFLPFNRGSDSGGAGNPTTDGKHQTFYLWEWIWQRDAWLELLHRYIHVEYPTEGSKAEKQTNARVIFPRFHQWDAVQRIVSHARDKGAGHSYLVEHSTGSGKSNTIAWLAHRLSNLHDDGDRKVFDKVIVITDRLVLDRQLQETIYQFEHAHGVVEKIDESSSQLADALRGEQAKIIISTLQKFPFILDQVGDLPSRTYAVVIDEAHSSQTGDAARDLRAALASKSQEHVLADQEAEELAESDDAPDPQDQLASLVRGRGRQANLSFFAFTATPKAKTLELFGTPIETAGGTRFAPFHLYSMRQAIEEGFILDVLTNYTTYKTYYRIEKAIREDPEYDERAAKAAIARYLTLHPHSLGQKAEIIVEHFRQHTAKKIGGQAKAMVVTSSRLHAVRYKQSIDRYIHEKGYTDVATLVAFSGTVLANGDGFTESNMNRFPESETARRFATDEYQVLIVAEKFQTGYSQPLLHTMYVDKPLKGLNAVQTLSRLNRIHPLKDDTFVLDFRNEAEDVTKAYEPWYEQTLAVPTDPNLMYDARRELDQHDVLREHEIESGVEALSRGAAAHEALSAAINPARDRYLKLTEEQQDDFSGALGRFIRTYQFLAQVVDFTDPQLERDYIYCKALDSTLPGEDSERLDLGSAVKLTHLRVEQTSAGSASLDTGGGEIQTYFDGKGPQHDPEAEHLSQIVNEINERFGLNLGEADQLLFDQYEAEWMDDDTLAAQARTNDLPNFRLVFDRKFMNTIVRRMDSNEEIFKKILDDDDFKALLFNFYATRLFERFRGD